MAAITNNGEKPAELPTHQSTPTGDETGTTTLASLYGGGRSSSINGEEQNEQQEQHDLAHGHSNAEPVWLATTLTLPREILFASVTCLVQFCTQAAFFQTLFLIHQIGGSFGVTNPAKLSWLVAGYSLTVGTFILFSGRLGDTFGYKLMLLIGMGWFSLWSMLAGFSVYSGYLFFVFSRVLQGIGPAIALPNALAIFGASYPPGHRKAMVFSFFGASAPVGAIVGAAAGSALELAWWPWVLWVLSITLFVIFAFFVIESRWAKRPLLPFDAINADVAFVLGAIACGWATFGVWTLYFVQILQRIRHLSPLLSSAWFCPGAVAGMIAAVATGTLLGPLRTPPPVVMTLALLAFAIGVTLTATTPVDQIYWAQTFVSVIIMPFGMDMSFPAATLILSDAVKKEHQGIMASLVNTVVNYGISLGVGFAGTVEVHVNNGGKTEEDMLTGFRSALYLGIGLAGLGVVICLTFLQRKYRKQ
ncbi:hypothetical protein SAPIO_CDS4258 [Scedosporium apiospermum]|uniref:Major facilitator superfamily (MFS) profile domain-containing protein n=1 Tax=Pseudallescheria apiosperma TaxID=563466 RepID=A0A084G8J3_PSEDA|nr:uncharacterized protein SAPIO_CDS4258 [Scedosporium apiospermum]KEZ43655.1 hypothetical protein SAPIO_CDS4258 [Scedosporium apiospermum]